MNFADSGLPPDPEVEQAFALLENLENSWANDNRVKIVRNITDSYDAPPATIAAASLLRLYIDDKIRETRGATGELYEELGKTFSADVMAELACMLATDMDAVLGYGKTKSLDRAHPTAKIYAMGHALFMLEDHVDKGFNGSFTITERGMSKDPPNEYMLKGLSDLINQTGRILNACHGVHEKLEQKLTAAIVTACHAVDAAEDEILRQKRNWRDAHLFPPPAGP